MAIYTHLSHDDVAELLSHYDVGTLESFLGIAEGVTNTNYLVTVRKAGELHKYILTLFEKHYHLEELPYFIHLMEWWHARGIHCPRPIALNNARYLTAAKDKPALMVSFVEGKAITTPELQQMAELGQFVARMHLAGQAYPHARPNRLSLPAWQQMARDLGARLDELEVGLHTLVVDELAELAEHWPSALPMGAVHADLFPDNIFFQKRQVSGVIDIYFACREAWAYDIAITLNAWCFDHRTRFKPERMQAFMQGYYEVRSLTDEEEAAMPMLLRGAAMRFLLTRADAWLNPVAGEVTAKDPLEYVLKLKHWSS